MRLFFLLFLYIEKRNAKNGLVVVSIDAYNQKGELVLKDVTEAIVKCKPLPSDG